MSQSSQDGVRTGESCDVDWCQGCGHAFDAGRGWFVDDVDVGEDADGGTAEIFRQDAEKFGEWQGFEEEDIGPWCDDCSWNLQNRRTASESKGVIA